MKNGKSFAVVIFTVLIILLVFGAASCSLFGISQSRTYYDTLDLKTPEKAVKTFVKAYQERDFWTVWLVFSGKTQAIVSQQFSLLDLHNLIDYETNSPLEENIPYFNKGLFDGEHVDFGYIFDENMLAASENSMLLFDLSGVVVITSSTPSSISPTQEAVDVTTNVGKVQGIIFRMVQAPSGKWRLYQVILPGGVDDSSDPNCIPWSIPEA